MLLVVLIERLSPGRNGRGMGGSQGTIERRQVEGFGMLLEELGSSRIGREGRGRGGRRRGTDRRVAEGLARPRRTRGQPTH